MKNDKIQRQENLVDIIDKENDLDMTARLRGWNEIYKRLGKQLNAIDIKSRYIDKHRELTNEELLHNLDVIDDIVKIINNI